MVEYHGLPKELSQPSDAGLKDGVYAAGYAIGDAKTSGVLVKRGNYISGGQGGIAFFGRMFGGDSVTLHFEVHCHGERDNAVFSGADSAVFELNGHLTSAGAQLHGVDVSGRELSLVLRFLR